MKIKKVEITNFRGINSLTLDFVDPGDNPLDLVVLAGPNGCGKSSVLEGCILACGHSELLGRKVGRQSFKQNIRAGCIDFEIKILMHIEGEEINIEFDSKIKHTYEITKFNEGTVRQSLKNLPIVYFSSWREPKLVGSLALAAAKPADSEENRLRYIKQHLINLKGSSAFKSGAGEAVNIEETDNTFEKINKAWKLFYPERTEILEAQLTSNKIEEGFDVFLVDHKNGTRIPLDFLSSGEIEIITFFSWFAIKGYSGGIIFIDEPELHLHPAWHRIILRALRTILPETQIICATHSTEILDSVYSYERFTLLPEDDPRIRMVEAK